MDIDDYDRLVGTVYRDDVNINLIMVRDGHAWWYRHYAGTDRVLAEAEVQDACTEIWSWEVPDPAKPELGTPSEGMDYPVKVA